MCQILRLLRQKRNGETFAFKLFCVACRVVRSWSVKTSRASLQLDTPCVANRTTPKEPTRRGMRPSTNRAACFAWGRWPAKNTKWHQWSRISMTRKSHVYKIIHTFFWKSHVYHNICSFVTSNLQVFYFTCFSAGLQLCNNVSSSLCVTESEDCKHPDIQGLRGSSPITTIMQTGLAQRLDTDGLMSALDTSDAYV